MSARIEILEPDVQERLRAALKELQEQAIPHALWCTGRTQLEQIATWAQHRAPLRVVNLLRKAAGMRPLAESENEIAEELAVTNCDGVNTPSEHQSMRAADIVALDANGRPTWDYVKYAERYKAIKAIMARHGFDCGGDWMTMPNGKPSPYTSVGLGWDPPHYQMKKTSQAGKEG